MAGSLDRVRAALDDAGIAAPIREMPVSTRTAVEAAGAIGCSPDQIAKSIVFCGAASGRVLLFLTAGGNRVDPVRAAALAAEALIQADAATIRARTGFAIGGVAPVGHLEAPRVFMDPRLADFAQVWAAAGTPRHVFGIAPDALARITGAVTGAFVV